MKIISRIVLSSLACGVFAAGCMSPMTGEEPIAQTEQELGGTTLAQERFVTYFAEAAKINEVGWCSGPFRCFGPKGLICSGEKTAFATVEWFSC
jgi:hypothetical protein